MADILDIICDNPLCKKLFSKKSYEYNKTAKKSGKHFCGIKCSAAIIKTNKLDIIGKTFNELTCTEELPKPTIKYKACYYLFICSCGNQHKAAGNSVVNGRIKCCRKCYIASHSQKFIGGKSTTWCGTGEISGSWWNEHVIRSACIRSLKVIVTIHEAWDIFLNQQRKCVFTGEILHFPQSNSQYGTASLDRINSNMGYIPHNIQWVHKDINLMKGNKSDEEFIRLCTLVSTNSIKKFLC